MKIKPKIWRGVHYPARKRDGVWRGEVPDDGIFWMSVTPKVVCVQCRKVWRGARTRVETTYNSSRIPPTACPQCGNPTRPVHPMARVPRRNNRRAWERFAKGKAYPRYK